MLLVACRAAPCETMQWDKHLLVTYPSELTQRGPQLSTPTALVRQLSRHPPDGAHGDPLYADRPRPAPPEPPHATTTPPREFHTYLGEVSVTDTGDETTVLRSSPFDPSTASVRDEGHSVRTECARCPFASPARHLALNEYLLLTQSCHEEASVVWTAPARAERRVTRPSLDCPPESLLSTGQPFRHRKHGVSLPQTGGHDAGHGDGHVGPAGGEKRWASVTATSPRDDQGRRLGRRHSVTIGRTVPQWCRIYTESHSLYSYSIYITLIDILSDMSDCLSCGGFVSDQYVRVLAPKPVGAVRVCPNYPDKLRDGADIRVACSAREQ